MGRVTVLSYTRCAESQENKNYTYCLSALGNGGFHKHITIAGLGMAYR